ncbi:hypothetical protein GCM10027360_40820 [Amycolatopsis echigonensis]
MHPRLTGARLQAYDDGVMEVYRELVSGLFWGGSSPGGDIAPGGCVGHPEA